MENTEDQFDYDAMEREGEAIRAKLGIRKRDPESFRCRLVIGKFPGREFDIDFWQELGDEAIMTAGWELIEYAQEEKGRPIRLQKDVVTFKRGRTE